MSTVSRVSQTHQSGSVAILRATWRLHRTLVVGAVGGMLVAAGAIAALQQLYASWPSPDGPGRVPWWFGVARMSVEAARLGVGLLPLALGLLIGAGVIAREIDRRTTTLAFTQSLARWQWFAAKILVVFVPVSAASVMLALVSREAPAYVGAREGRFAFEYFSTTPLIASLTTFAAILAGAVVALWVRNPLAAYAATLIVLLFLGIAVASVLRPNYAEPSVQVLSVEAAVNDGQYPLAYTDSGRSNPWTLSYEYVTADGRVLPDLWAQCPWHGEWPMPPEQEPNETRADFLARMTEYDLLRQNTQNMYQEYLTACFREHGADRYEIRYHHDSQFWRFQFTEAGLLVLFISGLFGAARAGLRKLT